MALFRQARAAISALNSLVCRNMSSPLPIPATTSPSIPSSTPCRAFSSLKEPKLHLSQFHSTLLAYTHPHISKGCISSNLQIQSYRQYASLLYMHKKERYGRTKRKKLHPLEGRPQLKGVVLKTLVKKPKKPNSANRKCVKLRLSTGREAIAYVPGEGHNLQEHNIVLVQGGRLQDTPGVKLTCVRGKYDLPHVKRK